MEKKRSKREENEAIALFGAFYDKETGDVPCRRVNDILMR